MRNAKNVLKNNSKKKNQKKTDQQQSVQQPQTPTLRFTPYAWAKLLFLRDYGPSEVGGFGITPADDLLLIEDIQLIKQQCSTVTVKFNDVSVADFFDEQVDQQRTPEQFGRIWIHTHPGKSADPSYVDEETFIRSFGNANWAIMFILAQGGASYARMRFNVGPGGETMLAVQVDCNTHFPASDQPIWQEEYHKQVTIIDDWVLRKPQQFLDYDPYGLNDYLDEDSFWLENDFDHLNEEPNSTGFLNNHIEPEQEELF